jgi:hypothetical protein
MKTRNITATAAAVALAGGLGMGAAAPAASASAAPRTYVVTESMGCCYLDPAVKPRTIYLGSGWGVGADFGEGVPRGPMHWTEWSASRGYGSGEFWAALYPGQEYYRASVILTNVKVHAGRRYFTTMEIAARGHRNIWLLLRGGAFIQK